MQNKHYFFFPFLESQRTGWAKFPTFTENLFWGLPLALPRKLAPLKKLAPIGTLSSLETLASLLPWILNSKQRYILKAKKFAEPELQSQNHQNPEKCKKCVLFPSVPVVVQRQAGRRDGAQTANWELVTSQDKIWDRLPLEYRLVRTTVH